MLEKIEAVFDSKLFRIFFAIWTGVYLIQVIKRENPVVGDYELWWIMAAMAVSIFIL